MIVGFRVFQTKCVNVQLHWATMVAGSLELSLVLPIVDGYRRFQKPQKPLT